MLEFFLCHPRQVISREQLPSKVWGLGYDPASNVVDVYIRYLRQKLGNDLIHTVRGRGYQLG
jgi:DNA-binding response OmpR family regulator